MRDAERGAERGALRGVPLLLGASALALGYLLGVNGLVARSLGVDESPLTPLARVGSVLTGEPQELLQGSSADWQRLQSDLNAVRASWDEGSRPILDLVVAVRGLENGGHPEWERGMQLCNSLGWPRCDRPALEELRLRSRP